MKSLRCLSFLVAMAACGAPNKVSENHSSDAEVVNWDSIQRAYAPVDTILRAYEAKEITADSAVRALWNFGARTHQPINVEMDSAMRSAAVRLHNSGWSPSP